MNFQHIHISYIIIYLIANSIIIIKYSRLSLIDTGIVAELKKNDQANFLALFQAIVNNDGKSVGRLMIERSR